MYLQFISELSYKFLEFSWLPMVLDALLNLRHFYVKNKRMEKQYSDSS